MGHIERRQKEKEEIKQLILDAARQIGTTEGWHALTIRKIADKIEYTPPIVYEYFENKEDLIREIVYKGFSKLSKSFNKVREEINDPRELIKALSMLHWDFAFENVELYQLMFSLERPAPSEEMAETIKLIENAFLSLIKEKDSLKEVILTWMFLMNGAISVVMKFPDLPHRQELETLTPRELFSRIINRFINSL